MDEGHARVLELFRALCDLAPEEQQRRLDAECDDEAVRAEVRGMLRADRGPSELLETPDRTRVEALFERALDEASREHPRRLPERIGSYRVLGRLGAGGMGEVFEAEQESPRRRVAIKVLRNLHGGAESLARFAREGRVLGQLKHVGIAQVYEVGTWESPAGPQPFLAMELVEGLPLDVYVAEQRLDLAARLELVVAVCAAVHHAHQRGVLHRDLKPSNVLVTPEGRPVVLDFGVARVLEGDESLAQATRTGELIGSLRAMSPEQAAGDSRGLDARSDVYALGVMLYELLSGQAPYALDKTPLHQAARIILEDEPTRLGLLDRRLRGDLETIVGKALQKERERRYASVEELALDLKRTLADQPIVARPPSAAYRLAKFTRRNRWLVAGTASTLVALILGLVGTLKFALRAEDKASEAVAAQAAALEAAGREQLAAARARREADKAVAARDLFLDTLREAQPANSRGRPVTVVEALDAAGERMRREGLDDPELEYFVHSTQASIHGSLEDYGVALEHALAARTAAEAFAGADGHETRAARLEVGFLRKASGDPDGARADYLALLEEFGANPERADEVLRLQILGNLGKLAEDDADFDLAQGYGTRAIAGLRRLGERRPLALQLQRCSGYCMMLGLNERALEEAEEAYHLAREVGVETFSMPLSFAEQYANALDSSGRAEEAIELYEEALRRSEEWYPGERRTNHMLRFNLALAQERMERFDEALENLALAFDGLRAPDGRHDNSALLVAHGTLVTLGSAGRVDEALDWYDRNLGELPANYNGWLLRLVRGQLLTVVGAHEEAVELLAQAYAGLSRELPEGNDHLVAALSALVRSSETLGREADGERYAALLQQQLDAQAAR